MTVFLQRDGDTFVVAVVDGGVRTTEYRIERLRRPERFVLMRRGDEVCEKPTLREAREHVEDLLERASLVDKTCG